MRRRAIYALPVAATAMAALSVVLSRAGPPRLQTETFGEPLVAAPFLIVSAVVGAAILSRHGLHAVGLAFVAMALIESVNSVMAQYAALALRSSAALPGWTWAAWAASWTWFGTVALIAVVLPTIFPTGAPLSRSWRGVLVLGAASSGALALSGAITPGPLEASRQLNNPLGIDHPAVELLGAIGFFAFALAILLGFVSMVLRFRRAAGVERQQIKWLLYAIAAFATSFLVAAYFFQRSGSAPQAIVILLISAFTFVPVACGIAILRYRLYDIDLLINRTLVYAAVTAVLAVTYFGAVILIQGALRPFTAGSELAVAASTLLVVALFQPIRGRIQGIVDRRFYRSRYDAARTLDAFSARLRNEVELDSVRADLLGVVSDAVRPSHVSMWLRERAR